MKKILLPLTLVLSSLFGHTQCTVYGIELDTTANLNYFVSINPSSGAITQINSLPSLENIENTASTIDPVSEYFITIDNRIIYTIDLNTGAILANPAISADVLELTYNNLTGNYMGIEVEYAPVSSSSLLDTSSSVTPADDKYYFVTVNPFIGVVNRLDSIVGVNDISVASAVYDELNDEFIFIGNRNSIVYRIDPSTGLTLSAITLSAEIQELQISEKNNKIYGVVMLGSTQDSVIVASELVSTGISAHPTINMIGYLTTLDPLTGIVTQLDSIAGLKAFIYGSSTIDTLTNVYTIVDQDNKILSLNLDDATLVNNPTVTSTIFNLNINIIPVSGALITEIEYSLNTNVNPISGSRLGNQADELFPELAESSVRTYPNPAKNMITVEINQFPTTLNIININGTILKQQVLLSKSNRIDISELKEGMYFFNLQNAKRTKTQRVSVL
jgi:Secretion system C-terminal sorting domain